MSANAESSRGAAAPDVDIEKVPVVGEVEDMPEDVFLDTVVEVSGVMDLCAGTFPVPRTITPGTRSGVLVRKRPCFARRVRSPRG